MSSKILIVDDEKKICSILEKILSDEGFIVKSVYSGEEALEVVETFIPELILMDQNMTGMNGIEATVRIKEKMPDITVIILTAYGSIPNAVEAIKRGAYDYILKPFDNEELLITISRALERNRLTKEINLLKKELQGKYDFKNIISISSKMQRMFEQIYRVRDTNATVLIQGESGTGKELVVKAIHYHSQRKDKPLVAINCGAIPVNLIESEFFGYERGAFTDAKERKIGKFEQANGGTIFLDEISELPLDNQVKLLRVLDEKKITRIGGNESVPVDIRVIAATNRDLQENVSKGIFRLDLFYRLNIFNITVPPLRERKEDIPLLVEHFIDEYNKHLNLSIKNISRLAMDYLQEYEWPGNVRELENAIQSAMILSKDEIIRLENLPLNIQGFPEPVNETDLGETGLEERIKQFSIKHEKIIILKALEKCNNNRTNTAILLKISRKTLFNKMKKYGISR
jgi:DNA-binding NtrC family response regulator